MATPAQLVETVSRATGLPLPTVVDIDRKLVIGNLRSKAGRGFSAARMTPLDAARLLTAVLASPQANEAADAVARYAQTRIDKVHSSTKLYEVAGLEDLVALPSRHGFVDALAAMIACVSTGSLAKLIANSPDGWAPSIEIFAFTRAVRGRIRFAGLPGGLTSSVEYIAEPGGAKSGRQKSPRRHHVARAADTLGDLEQSRRLTERTILPIAELLAAEN